MKRSEVKSDYKWDLSDIYASTEEWMSDYNKIDELANRIPLYKGKIYDSAESLYNFLEDEKKLNLLLEKLDYYAFLHVDEDITDEEANKLVNMISSKITSVMANLAFVDSELVLNGSMDLVDKYILDEPRLSEYRFNLEKNLRYKDHVLDEKTQSIVTNYNEIIDNFGKASNFLRTSEIDYGVITLDNGEEVKLAASNLSKYSRDDSRNVRRQVYENRKKAYDSHINTFATNYIGHIKTDELVAKLENYKSSIDEKFFSLNINKKVYDKLIESAKKHKDVYQKCLGLHKKVLKLDKLEPYDLNAHLVQNVEKRYSVEEAQEMIKKTFSFYGDYYVDILNKAFDNHWIDYVPNDNKPNGWYSAYVPNCEPRISANFIGRVEDISSLSHELGHLVNQYLSGHNQPSEYVYNSPFCAEVVSTNNEAILALTYDGDDIDVQMQLLENFIEVFSGNFFGAAMGAMFEEQAHKAVISGVPLTATSLNEIYYNIVSEFEGDIITTHSSNGWARVPHFFNSFYYFSYATGITAATALSSKLLSGEDNIYEKYQEYLKIGGSMYPLDSLKVIDIDMEDETVFDRAVEVFDQAIDKFSALLDKKEELNYGRK